MSTTAAGGSGVDALCDNVLASILARLPSTSVLRCRAVCRSWRRITTARSFLANHATRRPLQILTGSVYGYGGREVSATPLSVAGDAQPSRLFHRTRHEPSVARSSDVLYSLDGLLVVSQLPGLFAICNPSTRQWATLPALAPEPRPFDVVTCGFYSPHASSGEYRLLCQVRHKYERYYCILSTAGDALPRRCHGRRRPPRLTTSASLPYSVPVSRRGVLHWLAHPEAAFTGRMLAFDTDSEAFRLMPRPPEWARDGTKRKLLELDGELAVAVVKGVSTLAVWELRDYEAEVWTLRYRVEVAPPSSLFGGITTTDNHTSVEWSISWIFSAGDGAILIGQGYHGFAARLYDLREKRIRGEVSLLPRGQQPTFLVFRESLVSHGFFDLPPNSEVGHIKFN
ncbi:hypothetical protein HU200_031194 [Digitaria exilis]|uniref:F-box domain-containing protein n=1 Tax=Digitaria exilis TaxID=1010633 RepID=A0A835BQ42_9POAL|nr:hypothetical protein HU200_031194 [Digitaria exilis]CAB3476219.1 unnamed protein product [Digitaria exilis]